MAALLLFGQSRGRYREFSHSQSWGLTMENYQIVKTLDCSGLLCPLPVVKTKKALKDLQIGEILEMISTDPGSIPDMHAWANQTKHELLEAVDEGSSRFRFIVRKTH